MLLGQAINPRAVHVTVINSWQDKSVFLANERIFLAKLTFMDVLKLHLLQIPYFGVSHC